MRLTKESILDSISDLDAYGAIDELAGMLSRAVEEGKPRDIRPITEAMRSIERDLEVWADLEHKKLKAEDINNAYSLGDYETDAERNR